MVAPFRPQEAAAPTLYEFDVRHCHRRGRRSGRLVRREAERPQSFELIG